MNPARLSLAVLLVGCNPDRSASTDARLSADPDDTGPAAVEETDGSSGGDAEDSAAPEPSSASLTGAVVGPDGQPAEGVRVTLCHRLCRYVDTDPDGAFGFEEVEPNTYALHFTVLGREDLGWADLLVITELDPDEVRVLAEPVPMGELGPATEVTTAREVQVAEGLWLTIDPDTVELPFDADSLLLAASTPRSWPPELPSGDVLAVWYLDPFDAQVASGMSLRAANAWDLQPGEEAVLWTSSYRDYAWVEAGRVVVSEDGTEVVGGDLPVISTLVLARSQGD